MKGFINLYVYKRGITPRFPVYDGFGLRSLCIYFKLPLDLMYFINNSDIINHNNIFKLSDYNLLHLMDVSDDIEEDDRFIIYSNTLYRLPKIKLLFNIYDDVNNPLSELRKTVVTFNFKENTEFDIFFKKLKKSSLINFRDLLIDKVNGREYDMNSLNLNNLKI